jgi:hypothetical protein
MSEFADYYFCSTWDGDGEILDRENKIVWRFQTTGLGSRPTDSRTGRPPIFALRDAVGRELFTVLRERRFPLAQFAVVGDDECVCVVRQCNPVFTRYEFEFGDESKWHLHLPMFSVRGRAMSENGVEILVSARTRREWYMRFVVGYDSPALVAALVFVTRKKLQCT